MRKFLLTAAAVAAMSLTATAVSVAPAQAALVATGNPCAGVIAGGIQTDCAGFFAGNLLNGSPTNVADQILALQGLGIDTTGFSWPALDVPATHIADNGGSTTIDFAGMFVGPTVIGIHFGGGAFGGGQGAQATGFFVFDAGAGLDTITINLSSSSGVVLYGTDGDGFVPPTGGGVPEPATWAMMLIGFAGLGSALRRRRTAAFA